MKIKKNMIAIFAVTVLFLLCGCNSNKTELENLITKFEYSCNNLDIDAMLECIDPKVSDKIKLAKGIASLLTDTDSDEMIGELVSILTEDDSLNATDFFSSIKIEAEDIKTKKESGVANAVIEYSVGGENFKKDAEFLFVKDDETWYISSFNLK